MQRRAHPSPGLHGPQSADGQAPHELDVPSPHARGRRAGTSCLGAGGRLHMCPRHLFFLNASVGRRHRRCRHHLHTLTCTRPAAWSNRRLPRAHVSLLTAVTSTAQNSKPLRSPVWKRRGGSPPTAGVRPQRQVQHWLACCRPSKALRRHVLPLTLCARACVVSAHALSACSG